MQKALAITTDCTPRYCFADPVEGGRQAVAEAWRNLNAVGALPLAVTDNMNFGNPQRPEIMGQFVGCVQGMGEACVALDFPIVSGNVSLYNETNGRGILPTPAIGAVGLLANLDRMATVALKRPGQTLILIGETKGHLGQSLYLREVLGCEEGPPPPVDLAAERRHGDAVRKLIAAGAVATCHDLSDGGLLVALAEMCMAGGVGASIALPAGPAPHEAAFGEDQARYLVAVDDPAPVLAAMLAGGVPAQVLGTSGGTDLTVAGHFTISVASLRTAHEAWLPTYMAG
jgi:phosphoribosylformylglycinamidine synthase